jgi:hypothetical protein
MPLFNRKSHLERIVETVGDALDVPSGIKSGGSGKALKAGLITAGGLAALTAGSAGISSLRRRSEGGSDDS